MWKYLPSSRRTLSWASITACPHKQHCPFTCWPAWATAVKGCCWIRLLEAEELGRRKVETIGTVVEIRSLGRCPSPPAHAMWKYLPSSRRTLSWASITACPHKQHCPFTCWPALATAAGGGCWIRTSGAEWLERGEEPPEDSDETIGTAGPIVTA